ncbi:hypothetical protein ACLKA6_002600 [Drosophila palustris]
MTNPNDGTGSSHLPSSQNPADIVSRGCNTTDIQTSIWFSRPEFLKRSSEDWPRLTEPLPSPIEVRKRTTMICNEQPAANSEVVCRDSSKLTTGSKCDQASTVESQKDATIGDSKSIINQIIENSSSHSRTLRILSYVYRIYIRVMPNRLLKVREVVHIPAAELNVTFWRIIGHIQQSSFTEEIRLLANKKTPKPGMQNLTPFIHEMQLEDNVSVKVIRQKVTFLKQQFWNLWHRDYIHTLQRRSKWTAAQPNIRAGQLVIIYEDNTPPQQWNLARVTSAIPGKDGKVRVVDLRTNKGILQRPIHKIAPLPVN